MASRPELQAPPEIFYNDDEARKYTSSSRIIDIQAKLSERALELLALPDDGVPRLLLDIGCGSGLSGETLMENGHHWIGLDISESMLIPDIALEREAEGDLIHGDMGQGLGVRPGVIDGAVSISAVQWLCNADKSSHEPRLRLKAFFGSLYRCLARGARAVLQVYPENLAQRELMLGVAMRSGFSGGVVVDFPHSTKSRKEFLVLTCGQASLASVTPKSKGEDGESCPDDEESSGDEENHSVFVSDRHRPRKKQKMDSGEDDGEYDFPGKDRDEEIENDSEEEDEDGDGEEDDEEGSGEDSEEGEQSDKDVEKGEELEELEKEYKELQNQEQDIWRNLKNHKDEDIQKGQAVKNQRALWDKTLEFRFLLQKPFSSCNRLPEEQVKSLYCKADNEVSEAYSDVIASSKKTLDSILELQQALITNNPSITRFEEANSARDSKQLDAQASSNGSSDEEWLQISQIQSRMNSFRNKSIDKWHRKAQVTTGAAAIKDKLHAFNQSISEQVAAYMRDPSKMIKGMQQNRSAVAVFGNVPSYAENVKPEESLINGDPELLDDSEFYQQLLKEFFETVDPSSSETAFYALKRLQTKKRKIVDRRASKSRKIRYNVHEQIVNFMAPRRAEIPPTASRLFDLFGLKTQKSAS